MLNHFDVTYRLRHIPGERVSPKPLHSIRIAVDTSADDPAEVAPAIIAVALTGRQGDAQWIAVESITPA